ITGRKDIPAIHLTYSLRAAKNSQNRPTEDQSFLFYLENQRKNLKNAVLEAPRYRLDNLATFIETNAERLDHFLEAVVSYRKRLRDFRIKWGLIGLGISFLAGAGMMVLGLFTGFSGGVTDPLAMGIGAVAAGLFMGFWALVPLRYMKSRFHKRSLKNIDKLTPLETQTRRDSWQAVRELVNKYLQKTNGIFPMNTAMKEYAEVHRVFTEGTRDIRKALNELSNLKYDR
ncbi:MAG: Dynamin family protein, partial [Desulfosalsimonadaceae bacterium]|nr:Dynamin family protein [Desulfosalsimonadaceae bacterium]